MPRSLAHFIATRYVQPLREGGSLPAVVDTDEGGLFVVKFRGAGQGARVLVAELIASGLAEALELPVPEHALVSIEPTFGKSEPDPEIQELLARSHGVNVGLRYLDGAFNFDGLAAADCISNDFSSRVVWLDALITNPDRTHRNPNLLIWDRAPWLIDHGAALYAHYSWETVTDESTRTSFPLIKRHVLLACADAIESLDETLAARLTREVLVDVVAAVPDALLEDPVIAAQFPTPNAARARYVDYLSRRLEGPRAFAAEAAKAHLEVLREPPRPLSARR